jgi:xanthine dehydrogenase accessory protein XdhC
MTALAESLRRSLAAGEGAVLVTLADAQGSTPREAGARMMVWADRTAGTIGGGRLEFEAMAAARRQMSGNQDLREVEIPLGPAIGQCCGGHVTVRLEPADAGTLERLARLEHEERAALPPVLLFGAGHVGKAIAFALSPLPLALTWIDNRPEEFPEPVPGGVERVIAADPAARVSSAPSGAAYLILTHSHALDYDLAEAVLRRGDFAYAGLIGSSTKRRRFERWFLARGGRAAELDRLVCPIGAGLGRDKRPAVIAAMVAAELLVAIDKAAGCVVSLDQHRRQS